MQYCKFAVDETPWCVWDWELAKQNLNFIQGIDAYYFEYLAHSYANSDDDQEHKIALALRTAYSHGLETFFALLFAAIQAPDCVIGWVHKYNNQDLKRLLEKVKHRRHIYSKIRIDPITWKNISKSLLSFALEDKEKEKRIKQKFAVTWQKFADDFIEKSFIPEYNSIKHGFRAKSGGFWLAMGRQDSPNVPAPADRMQLFGKSEFGSTFYTVDSFDKRNFRLLSHSRGWQLERFYVGLYLISLSLQNILSFLKIVNGVDPSMVEFSWADPESLFEEPWKSHPSLSGVSMNNVITLEQITPFSKDEILSTYETNNE